MNRAVVHLIDDDAAVLDALSLYLAAKGFDVHSYASAEAALSVLSPAETEACIVSDVRMPGMTGLDLQKALIDQNASLPLILMSGHGDVDMAVAAVKAGAYDFLVKPFGEDRLVAAIKEAIEFASKRKSATVEYERISACRRTLTERQRQVMDLAVLGQTNKEIGIALGISARTVEIYRAAVMERMGARSLAELVRMAVKLSPSLE